MSELPTLISCIKHDIEALGKSIAEMKKTHAQILTEEWITRDQVMQILQISTRTLNNLKSRKMLPYSKVNGIFYFRTSDIENLLNQNYIRDLKATSFDDHNRSNND
jgi:hypothetical protein